MGEPREVGRFANFYYRMREDGSVQWRHVADKDDPEGISWHREAENNAAIIREVSRLQEENRRLREEGIRDTMHILFNECEWGLTGTRRGVTIYFPPGFVLPQEQTISRTAMADAFANALLPLVP